MLFVYSFVLIYQRELWALAADFFSTAELCNIQLSVFFALLFTPLLCFVIMNKSDAVTS